MFKSVVGAVVATVSNHPIFSSTFVPLARITVVRSRLLQQTSTPYLKNTCHCYFLNNSVKHRPILIMFGKQKKRNVGLNDFSFAYLTLMLSLHYLVKCRSRSLTDYNNTFILDSAYASAQKITDTTKSFQITKAVYI